MKNDVLNHIRLERSEPRGVGTPKNHAFALRSASQVSVDSVQFLDSVHSVTGRGGACLLEMG